MIGVALHHKIIVVRSGLTGIRPPLASHKAGPCSAVRRSTDVTTETPFLVFANGKNDYGIGWNQAWNPCNGDPANGDATDAFNRCMWFEQGGSTDTASTWEMTCLLISSALNPGPEL